MSTMITEVYEAFLEFSTSKDDIGVPIVKKRYVTFTDFGIKASCKRVDL